MMPVRALLLAFVCIAALASLDARVTPNVPTARLVRASRVVLPGAIDSNVPMTWDLVDGRWTLFAVASWGGIPTLFTGTAIDRMQRIDAVRLEPYPGWGVWIESVVAAEDGTWYGYYHHEMAGEVCGRTDRSIVSIGAARSADRGLTWENLGVVLAAPPGDFKCDTTNRYVLGGVGDLSVILDPEHRDLYFFVSQYSTNRSAQGVAVARMAWADRDQPQGRITVWQDGVWLPARGSVDADEAITWTYPLGTPLVSPSKPWHDGQASADAFWGPSVHWNTYLERYVMLLNRTKDESFTNEGLYVSYAPSLDNPRTWSTPRKIMNGGGWYPQVAGLEAGAGTDKLAGKRARFFVTGRSEYFIDFER
jgi:hypothetical protein